MDLASDFSGVHIADARQVVQCLHAVFPYSAVDFPFIKGMRDRSRYSVMSHLGCDVIALLTLVIQRLQAILLQYSSLRWLRYITGHYCWYDTDSFLLINYQNAVLECSWGSNNSIHHSWVLLTGL